MADQANLLKYSSNSKSRLKEINSLTPKAIIATANMPPQRKSPTTSTSSKTGRPQLSASRRARTPLPSSPVPKRFEHGTYSYQVWMWHKSNLRRRGITADIREPTAAEETLKHRCVRLSCLRWSQSYSD
ncbi:hypothetical protein MFRU_001g02830 [Monilinia fructicola]|nr:hypothetical protein MFRU_001g02830 [Monilinia fructicola]